jgi:hypothetical protein
MNLTTVNLTTELATITYSTIYDSSYKEASRKRPTDFTRNRKMPFEEVMLFMLLSFKCSTQSALRRFFTSIGKPVSVKQQSFSEARKKINVSAFVTLYKLTVDVMTRNCHKKWHDYRVYAIDGSKLALPADKKLLKHYGGHGRKAASPTAQGSILYDVLNDTVADALITPMSADERTLAKAHIETLGGYAHGEKKLAILDRGYPSFGLIEKFESEGLHYLMRVRDKFNLDADAQTESNGYILLKKGGKTIRTRVIKLKLDSGETEVLITNITDRRLGWQAFKKLYFMRWPVETKYDIVKNKLQLENFTSLTVEGIEQDFYASMYLTNVAAAAAIDAQSEIAHAREGKGNKYGYKANTNELIGVLKDRLVFALTHDDPSEQAAAIQCIIDEITRSVIPIRAGRSTPRNRCPRKAKHHHNRKINS